MKGIFTVLVFLIFSAQASAIQNGVPRKSTSIVKLEVLYENPRPPQAMGISCTATKIGWDYLITAAHCIPGKYNTERVWVTTSENFSVSLAIAGIYISPNYTGDVHRDSDVALVRVRDWGGLALSNTWPYGGQVSGSVKLNGYGCYDQRKQDGRLRTGPSMVLSREFLSDRILSLLGSDDSNSFVTIGNNVSPVFAGMCQGDSGGPVFMKIRTRRYLIGINSFYDYDEGNKQTNFSVHARISSVAEWLRSFGIRVLTEKDVVK
jgi:hypothetical protein